MCAHVPRKSEAASAPGTEGVGVVESEEDALTEAAWDQVTKVPLAVMRISDLLCLKPLGFLSRKLMSSLLTF